MQIRIHTVFKPSKARDTFHSISELPKGAKVAIVGAGLSGIELASELRESRADLEILLYDRGPRILRNFRKNLVTIFQNGSLNTMLL